MNWGWPFHVCQCQLVMMLSRSIVLCYICVVSDPPAVKMSASSSKAPMTAKKDTVAIFRPKAGHSSPHRIVVHYMFPYAHRWLQTGVHWYNMWRRTWSGQGRASNHHSTQLGGTFWVIFMVLQYQYIPPVIHLNECCENAWVVYKGSTQSWTTVELQQLQLLCNYMLPSCGQVYIFIWAHFSLRTCVCVSQLDNKLTVTVTIQLIIHTCVHCFNMWYMYCK